MPFLHCLTTATRETFEFTVVGLLASGAKQRILGACDDFSVVNFDTLPVCLPPNSIHFTSSASSQSLAPQTNVFPSAQRRKMRPFEDFKRKAVVVIPSDAEFKRRIEQRAKDEGKEVPERAVLEMKGSYCSTTTIATSSVCVHIYLFVKLYAYIMSSITEQAP